MTLPDNVEWIVVDNASQDDSAAVAESLGARVISLPKNRGFGGANNVGFSSSEGRYVGFVNPDVSIDPTSLKRLEEEIDSNARALVAPQLLNPDGTAQPNGRGAPYLPWKVLHRIAPHKVETTYRKYAETGEVVPVDWLTGAVVAGDRTHLAQLGPWDERFFVYWEDTDLAYRNAESGGQSLLVGDVRWTHSWGRATATWSWNAWRLELASMVKFYARYPRFWLCRGTRG